MMLSNKSKMFTMDTPERVELPPFRFVCCRIFVAKEFYQRYSRVYWRGILTVD